MAIDYSAVPYIAPADRPALSAFPSSTTFEAISTYQDSRYKFGPRTMYFAETRDESLFGTFATDVKAGLYPWYNSSAWADEEGQRLWDFRIFRMPLFLPTPLPMSRNSVSTSAGSGSIELRRGAITTTVRGRNLRCRTILRWVRMDTVTDPSDGLDYFTGTYTQQGTTVSDGVSIDQTSFQEFEYDTNIPEGFDPRVTGDLLMLDFAYVQYLPNATIPGLLSFLQIWARGPGDFPSGSY